MIDPILSLSFSIHSSPGVYALLLGSGVSRSANIPTGWEIVLDLIRQLAKLQRKDCEPNPVDWYVQEYGEEPDYSKLLETIAKTQTERNRLLKGYFEPTDEEREQDLKSPREAHKAIAELVRRGYIRVIITTNFDRLLEKALEVAGITPTVISTSDAAESALPLTHTECIIIKINGDYLDHRIKNTTMELETYDVHTNKLLDRVFDEYGLVVCGWSAEWDTALRAAMERCQSHRFTTYWATRKSPKEIAQKLINLRRAEAINIQDADSFFTELSEKVKALEDIARPHPLSIKIAVATLQRYLVDIQHRIRMHKLLKEETEKLYSELSEENFPFRVQSANDDEFEKNLNNRIRKYEEVTKPLQSLLITGCYYGEHIHDDLWVECLQRIANPSITNESGGKAWLDLRRYPALILLYSCGLAALAKGKYETLAAIFNKATVKERNENHPIYTHVNWHITETRVLKFLAGQKTNKLPLSQYINSRLREPLREYISDDEQYEKYFAKFEYLLALVYIDWYTKLGRSPHYPIGSFIWKPEIIQEVYNEATGEGDNWPPLKAGLFDNSIQRFMDIKQKYDPFISDAIERWLW